MPLQSQVACFRGHFLILLIVELWEVLRRCRELPGAQEPCVSGQ